MKGQKQTELERIRSILASHPKGLTIEEISQMLPLNRNSTAKYLNTLHISGHVELREFGRAKVFSLTERVPLSQMLSLSRDLILVLDRDHFIIHTNESLQDFFSQSDRDLTGHRLEYTPLAGILPETLGTQISEALNGRKIREEVCIVREGDEHHFLLNMVPVVFDSGSSGVSLCFEDITDLRNYQIYLEHLVNERTEKLDIANQRLKQKIEELKAVKDELEINEKRFRLFATNARDIIYRIIAGDDPWYEFISPAVETITGYTYESFVADPRFAFSIIHPDDREILTGILAGRAFSEECRIRWLHKDGSTIWIGEKNTPVLDETGRITAIEGIARDISDRVKSEEQLASSNAYNRSLIETSLDPMMAVDAAGIIRDLNRAMEDTLGRNREIIIGSPAVSWFTRPETVETAFQQALSTGSVRNVRLFMTGRGGIHVPVLLTAGIYPSGKTGQHNILATFRDISEVLNCENALLRTETEYNALLEVSPNGVFVTDLTGSVLHANRQAVILTGYPDEGGLKGMAIKAIIPEVPHQASIVAKVSAGERIHLQMTPIIMAGGGRTCADVTIGMVPSRDGTPSSLLFLLIDPVCQPSGMQEPETGNPAMGFHDLLPKALCSGMSYPETSGIIHKR